MILGTDHLRSSVISGCLVGPLAGSSRRIPRLGRSLLWAKESRRMIGMPCSFRGCYDCEFVFLRADRKGGCLIDGRFVRGTYRSATWWRSLPSSRRAPSSPLVVVEMGGGGRVLRGCRRRRRCLCWFAGQPVLLLLLFA